MGNEGELIQRITRALPSVVGRGRGAVRLGIGDDAVVLSPGRSFEWLMSCDAFVEGVHFLANVHPADSVGYKALARAASDLVAMGAKPRFFLLTLTLPPRLTGRWLNGFLRGMGRAAQLLGMRLIGGDTTSGKSASASVTVIGQVHGGQAITRSGAQVEDHVYVSGKLGRAQLGLELALAKGRTSLGGRSGALIRPHLYPRIRVGLGLWLSRRRIPSAMMDLSDGLSTDLGRLCEASGVGARLYVDRIPTARVPSEAARLLQRRRGRSAGKVGTADRTHTLQRALHGGEDYELLFSVSPRKEKELRRAPRASDLACIGEITGERGVVIVDEPGREEPLKPGGWDPFR